MQHQLSRGISSAEITHPTLILVILDKSVWDSKRSDNIPSEDFPNQSIHSRQRSFAEKATGFATNGAGTDPAFQCIDHEVTELHLRVDHHIEDDESQSCVNPCKIWKKIYRLPSAV